MLNNLKMKSLYFFLTSLLITSVSCFQSSVDVKPSKDFDYHSAIRNDGTAFYAFEHSKGQVHYMLDYGDNKGVWTAFGPKMTNHSEVGLLFDVIERAGAASFYLLHPKTGQLFYTVDGSNGSGTWQSYGNLISSKGNASLEFDAEGRFEGNSFYALDTKSGQMYYMNDFGPQAGEWLSYGNEL